jgi:DNA ligase-associated metallophosphoesterase
MRYVLAGEQVWLHPQRALHWPAARTLFVADVHLGKADAFRAGGLAVPAGPNAATLDRLSAVVAASGAQSLIVLGDLLHAASGRTASLEVDFARWRSAHAALAITLVRGNHDSRAGDPPPGWRIDVVDAPSSAAPFLLCHEPPGRNAGALFGFALCGHVHPAVHLAAAGLPDERLPCFVLGRDRAILPAFGNFTGHAVQAWAEDDTIVAIAAGRLFRIPRASV